MTEVPSMATEATIGCSSSRSVVRCHSLSLSCSKSAHTRLHTWSGACRPRRRHSERDLRRYLRRQRKHQTTDLKPSGRVHVRCVVIALRLTKHEETRVSCNSFAGPSLKSRAPMVAKLCWASTRSTTLPSARARTNHSIASCRPSDVSPDLHELCQPKRRRSTESGACRRACSRRTVWQL
jgi:hypothetical protein